MDNYKMAVWDKTSGGGLITFLVIGIILTIVVLVLPLFGILLDALPFIAAGLIVIFFLRYQYEKRYKKNNIEIDEKLIEKYTDLLFLVIYEDKEYQSTFLRDTRVRKLLTKNTAEGLYLPDAEDSKIMFELQKEIMKDVIIRKIQSGKLTVQTIKDSLPDSGIDKSIY